ncbi:CAP domain-containing protein [uncultured Erythrobacter sp.]|uniref:CAP domain-containing protein n=1 Tax=uncultured Erythrobacter sp. TaxID=263913 RepID=UPI00261624DA|nr:CAP domain-containing protein [uncultured Erythrobacter sp.]
MSIRATIAGTLALVGVGLAVPGLATDGDAPEERIWLAAHNAERAEFGVAPLRWNDDLAREAQRWARKLAREERLQHSTREERNRTGENLWMGTARSYSPDAMIAAFTNEKQYFSAGEFPRVSITGDWKDVGHYTQIVWAETREVGCARAPGERFDVLVCRYWPAGNVMGQRIEPREQLARR